MTAIHAWLTVEAREAPLIFSFPHTGTSIPADIEANCLSPRIARRDADWWIDQLYDFGRELGATFVHTAISRTVIDVNRDPSGVSLYPGQATTELVPTTTFDGDALWKPGDVPDQAEIERRQTAFFDPYHDALAGEIKRLRRMHDRVVLYDCHSIRSVIPRLFDGTLPVFNIGTNSGAACASDLERAITDICQASGQSTIANGRFKGGYITRHHAKPSEGVHAVQMELACRGYMREPIAGFNDALWPTPYDVRFAEPIRDTLRKVAHACLAFARTGVHP